MSSRIVAETEFADEIETEFAGEIELGVAIRKPCGVFSLQYAWSALSLIVFSRVSRLVAVSLSWTSRLVAVSLSWTSMTTQPMSVVARASCASGRREPRIVVSLGSS